MVVVPAGSFDMGSPDTEAGRFQNEGPLHRVSIRAFALGRTHVTRGQFAAFVKAVGYWAGGSCWTLEKGKYKEQIGRYWKEPGFLQTDNHPVVCVDWLDAKAYVAWLSVKTGKSYRLRARRKWNTPFGAGRTPLGGGAKNADQACANANVGDQSLIVETAVTKAGIHNCTNELCTTSPVGSFTANGFGLYDMTGNVWSWTEDCWHPNYLGAPADGSAWTTGYLLCDRRVQKGGSSSTNRAGFGRRSGFATGRLRATTTTGFAWPGNALGTDVVNHELEFACPDFHDLDHRIQIAGLRHSLAGFRDPRLHRHLLGGRDVVGKGNSQESSRTKSGVASRLHWPARRPPAWARRPQLWR